MATTFIMLLLGTLFTLGLFISPYIPAFMLLAVWAVFYWAPLFIVLLSILYMILFIRILNKEHKYSVRNGFIIGVVVLTALTVYVYFGLINSTNLFD
jgi:hypothetical protein